MVEKENKCEHIHPSGLTVSQVADGENTQTDGQSITERKHIVS